MVSTLIRMLEGIFALGLLGSIVVLLLTLVEDAKMLFEKDKNVHSVIGDSPSPAPSAVQVAATS